MPERAQTPRETNIWKPGERYRNPICYAETLCEVEGWSIKAKLKGRRPAKTGLRAS